MAKYARNITEAYDMSHENTHNHIRIQDAVTDAPSKHPIQSMTKTLGVNPPAGVDIQKAEGETGEDDIAELGEGPDFSTALTYDENPVAENGAYKLTVIDNSLYEKFEYWLEQYTQGSLHSSAAYIPFEPAPTVKLYVDGTLYDVDVAVAYSTDELPGISGACVISTDTSGGWAIAEGLKYSSNDRGIWAFEPANTPSINKMAVFFENPDNYSFQAQES